MTKQRNNELHHYVPQFYLRHWCDADGKMWIHPRDGSHPYQSGPRSFCAEIGLYDTSKTHLLRAWDQESDLSRSEAIFAKKWPEIFAHASDKRTKMNLARYLAISYLRHPNTRRLIDNVNTITRELISTIRPNQETIDVCFRDKSHTLDVDHIREKTEDTQANIQEGFLRTMRSEAQDIANTLHQRKWGILVSPGPVVVTGDCPFVLWRGKSTRRSFGIRTPGTQISFPLSPRSLLLIDDDFTKDGMLYPLQSPGNLNAGVVEAAERFVFSCTKDIITT